MFCERFHVPTLILCIHTYTHMLTEMIRGFKDMKLANMTSYGIEFLLSFLHQASQDPKNKHFKVDGLLLNKITSC